MIPREHRLPASVVFQNTFSVSSQSFLFKYAKNNLDGNRYAFVVSKKVCKTAVARNRVRRRVRAWVESNMPNIKPGYDILLIIRQDLSSITYQDIKEELQTVFTKASLLL